MPIPTEDPEPGANPAAPADAGDGALTARLERTFTLLGKRIYSPSFATMRAAYPGLDRSGLPVLAALADHGEQRPSDIAAVVGLDISTVSRHVGQLERLGLVIRRPDQLDGRALRISLTETGAAGVRELRANRTRLLTDLVHDWDDTDRRQLLGMLDRLLDALTDAPNARPAQDSAGSSRTFDSEGAA